MNNVLSISVLCLILVGCNAVKPAATAPQPQSVSIVESWAITVANSPAPPTGWTLQPQTVSTQTIPVDPCATDFTNLMNPNTMSLPGSGGSAGFESCAYITDVPLPEGQSNWLQTAIMGTTTDGLYSGEGVYYAVEYSSADGSTRMVLGGNGTFNSTTSEITGSLDCLTINGAITDSCTAWHTTFTARLATP
jgi:hypothetical protein